MEIEIIRAINAIELDFTWTSVKLSQFYGIEIGDFACEIARLSLWLAEHQINKQWEAKFNFAPPALPLCASGNIVCGNSLRLDWNEVCPKSPEDEVYVIGNPPFLGTLGRSDEQREDMKLVFSGFKSLGNLDFVACWFWKGANYIKSSKAEITMVATNSLCQGEQVATLWPPIFKLGLKIHIAYPTFSWANNARDKAAVHVVIIGLSENNKQKKLFQYVDNLWHKKEVENISPYLIVGNNICVQQHSKPLSTDLKMIKGNQPTDGGNLLLDIHEKNHLINIEPESSKWIKKVLGAQEFLNAKERWCLWLADVNETEIKLIPYVHEKVLKVKEMRLASRDKGTQKLAERPHQFRDLNNPDSYILIPSVSSERRMYIPIGLFNADVISTNLNYIVPNGTLYEFGILTSLLHNDWMRLVAGRLKSDYRYSASVVYNTFPWPDVTESQRRHIMALAKEIIFAREDHVDMTLAQMYNPDTMPPDLLAAHQALDLAVDRLYQAKPFKDTEERLSHLLARYEALTMPETCDEKLVTYE